LAVKEKGPKPSSYALITSSTRTDFMTLSHVSWTLLSLLSTIMASEDPKVSSKVLQVRGSACH